MSFRDTLQQAIALARAWGQEESDRAAREGGVNLFEKLEDFLRNPPQKSERFVALRSYLESLPDEVQIKLQTVMYLGRDNDRDVRELHKYLQTVTPDAADARRTMLEKVPLGMYLQRGMEIADEIGVDLESSFD